MKRLDNKGFGAIEVVLAVVIVAVLGFVGYQAYNVYTNGDTNDEQLSGKVEKKEKTKEVVAPEDLVTSKFNGGISLSHDAEWTASGDTKLVNLSGERQYSIQIQDNENQEYLAKGGAYSNQLKEYGYVVSAGKRYYIVTSNNQFAYVSSCKPTSYSACSIKNGSGNLIFIMLSKYEENAQSVMPLDFSREDDKQALDDFLEILKTIKVN